jgi:hypothetical protein
MPEDRLRRTREAYKGERVLTRVELELARLADEIHTHANRRVWDAIADSTGDSDEDR